MSVAVVDFQWPVSREGHRMITIRGRRFVTTGRPVADLKRRPDRYRWFKPFLDTPTLFRVFADWGESETDILAFSDEYGLLATITEQVEVEVHGRRMWAAPVEHWRKTQRHLRLLLREWERVQRGDEVGLRALELDERRSSVRTMDDPRLKSATPPMIATTLPPLVARAAYRVMWDVNHGLLGVQASPVLNWDPEEDRFRLGVTPGSLEGVFLLQIAEFVAGLRNYRACAVCGKHMEISTELSGYRTNRIYCSDACRLKAFRRRKAGAGNKG